VARLMTIPEKMFDDVARFSDEVLGLKVPDKPRVLSYERQQFAVNFLREEIDEFQRAWDIGSVPDAADAMIDLVYVALGRLIEMGVPPGPVFQEVQRANMEKRLGRTKRGNDTDAAKPEGWKPPDHSWLLTLTEEEVAVLKMKPVGAKLMWDTKVLFTEKVLKDIAHNAEVEAIKEEVKLAQKKDPLKKPQTALIPYESTVAQAQAMAYGAYVKYEPWDWTKGRPFIQLLSSINHHLAAWADRERDDPESKVHHLGHALADIGMLIAFEAMGRGDLDDRRPVDTITMHILTEEET